VRVHRPCAHVCVCVFVCVCVHVCVCALTCEEQLAAGVVVAELHVEFALCVLEAMALVNHDQPARARVCVCEWGGGRMCVWQRRRRRMGRGGRQVFQPP
jgi:hypothetical protein